MKLLCVWAFHLLVRQAEVWYTHAPISTMWSMANQSHHCLLDTAKLILALMRKLDLSIKEFQAIYNAFGSYTDDLM